MLAFTVILLAILWIFQTICLNDFYKSIKMNELNNAVDNVESIINNENLTDAVETIAHSYDICILITDTAGTKIATSEQNINCMIHKVSNDELLKLYGLAMENGGEYYIKDNAEIYEDMINNHKNDLNFDKGFNQLGGSLGGGELQGQDGLLGGGELQGQDGLLGGGELQGQDGSLGGAETFSEEDNLTENETSLYGEVNNRFTKMPNMPDQSKSESVMMVKVFTLSDGSHCVAYFNSVISPIGATVHTIRIQLIYISIIMVVLSLVIALLISIRIAKPIIKITDSANEIAKGDYNVKFEGEGYKEIEELSDTLNYTAKELAKTENLQRELIANVSHDLRTPLTMITGYSEVMRDIPGENTPENVQVVIDEAKRLTNLVNDLLDISKLQSGVSTLELKEYDLTESIKSVIDRYAKLVEQNGYTIEFDYNQNVRCEADEFKIYQVIYNLVNNAVDYSGEAKYVKVRQIVTGSIVRIEVMDKGEGIEKDKLESVWERYYKIDKKHKRTVMGTGLGLSIVNNILKLHNANYGVESELGFGSTFWFELKINK